MKLSHVPIYHLLHIFNLIIFSVQANDTDWPEPSKRHIIARRSQRDLSANVSISHLSLTGVNLGTTVFSTFGYNQESVLQVYNLLNTGIQTLYIDLYWNEQLMKFQLCPYQYNGGGAAESVVSLNNITCLTSLSFNNLTSTIQNYIQESNTNLFGNLIILIFNLYYLNDTSMTYATEYQGTWNDTLTSVMTHYFGDFLYTPNNLEYDRTTDVNNTILMEGFPRLSKFLFTQKKRLVTFINKNEIPSTSNYNVSDDSMLFFNLSTIIPLLETSTINSLQDVITKSKQDWRFVSSSNELVSSNTIHDLIINGYSPILNHTVPEISNVSDIFSDSLWSWAEGEPLFVNEATEKYSEDTQTIQQAYKCAAMALNGSFYVSNCYEEKHFLMQSTEDRFNWSISQNQINYFNSWKEDDKDRTFNVPKDALERKSAALYLQSLGDVNFDNVWIDLNSINVDNCWVTGGPYASCPYETVSSNRNFVEMVAAASICCWIILILIALLRLPPVPVRDNRKHWKKLMNEYSTSDYDGVPS